MTTPGSSQQTLGTQTLEQKRGRLGGSSPLPHPPSARPQIPRQELSMRVGGGEVGKPLPSAGCRTRGKRSPSGPSWEGKGEESWADKGNRAVGSRKPKKKKKTGSERRRDRTDLTGSAGLGLVEGSKSARWLNGTRAAGLASPGLPLRTPGSGPSLYP